jgi:hypothetical protein
MLNQNVKCLFIIIENLLIHCVEFLIFVEFLLFVEFLICVEFLLFVGILAYSQMSQLNIFSHYILDLFTMWNYALCDGIACNLLIPLLHVKFTN